MATTQDNADPATARTGLRAGQATGSIDGARRTAWIATLCRDDLFEALAASRWLACLPRCWLKRLFDRRIDVFARELAAFDDRIARDGLTRAGIWGLQQWAGPVSHRGVAAPPGGPRLLVSNHPGLVDAVAVLASLAGHDLRLLVAERPLFTAMPALGGHLITVTGANDDRARALRSAVRHLRGGGTLLTYPAGRIEPDPAHRPAAARSALADWSPSAAHLARRVPGLTVQTVAVADVFSAWYRTHWLARHAAGAADRDAIAAALQVLGLRAQAPRPRLIFGPLLEATSSETLHRAILAAMRRQLAEIASGRSGPRSRGQPLAGRAQ